MTSDNEVKIVSETCDHGVTRTYEIFPGGTKRLIDIKRPVDDDGVICLKCMTGAD